MNKTIKRSLLRFRRVPIVAVQLALVAASYWLAFQLRFDSRLPDWAATTLIRTLPWLVAIRGLTFLPFRLYEGLWKYTGVYDLKALVAGILTSSALFTLIVESPLGPPEGFPRSILIIDGLLAATLLGGIRMVRRVVSELGSRGSGSTKRVLVYGAGDAGQMIVREMRQNPSLGNRPVGFIDDDPAKVGRRIHGVRVLGRRQDIADIVDAADPTEILLALPGVEPAEIRKIVRSLETFMLPIKTLPTLREIIAGKVGVEQIRTLRVEDLLARSPVGLDGQFVRRLIHGRRVLVTGAGGSIGSELCRQILTFAPSSLVLLDRYENSLHAVRLELQDGGAHKSTVISAAICDVTDAAAVKALFAAQRPELVFHAAAHKHVPLMEENPCEAVKNNVRGTRILAAASEAAGVDRFILISTDKAANPSSVMGASKRLAELSLRAQAEGSGTSFAVVRFGNVLGSNGSVVPRFLEQIQKGGPVTVTHPDVRRFFMLIPEAVQLVLHAAAEAESGDTYVLDMGEQVRVVDLARNLIRLSGRVPDDEIKIAFTGLRPGEKLEEELCGAGEQLRPSSIPKVFVVGGKSAPTPEFMRAVGALEELALSARTDHVLAELRALTGLASGDSAREIAASSVVGKPVVSNGAEPAPTQYRQACPRCGARAHRAKTRRIDQQVRKQLTTKRLFICDKCSWRGWLVPVDRHVSVALEPGVAPDLSALDRLASGAPGPSRRSFSPKDLH